ncbi:hypothetical protein SJZ82_05660 [Serratia marcescens]|uniref:hypothetical protein n=1 Tax=Serratia TaxID=613 RepID=UPI0007454CC7|nr:hypothetical protein [Serratia marcescens]MDX6800668.1 hypothetical protein [Serratia marcescens]MDX6905127.1 hypothetical protein [Serratia marcescens]CUY42821.1 Uncharacterised protein [Serratia marcescens]HEJ9051058.1 hypothetical protein [Serratia marcescens]
MLKRTRSLYENCIRPELNIYSVGMLFMFAISMLLLLFGFLGGAEFVAFIIASAVLAIIIKMLPEISEFSLAGNTVKLKQKLDEAEDLTESLRNLKRITLNTMIELIMRHPGGFGSVFITDERIPDFIDFYRQVEGTEFERDLAEKIKERAQIFESVLEREVSNYHTHAAVDEVHRNDYREKYEEDKSNLKVIKSILARLKDLLPSAN